jgi:hypothetical protein
MSDNKTLELPEGMTANEAIDVLREYHETEEAQIVSNDTLSRKDDRLAEFAGVFRDALKSERDLKESTIDAMPVDALAEEFRGEDGEIQADTLSQSPETEATDETPEPESDTLSGEDKEEVRDMLRRADLLESRTPDHADTLRSEAAELAGVDDHEEIEVDAL